MFKVIRKTPLPFLKKKEVWFADKPGLSGFLNSFYMTPKATKSILGYIKAPYFTKVIDLSAFDEVSLLASFEKNNTYKIKRAQREGVLFELEESLDLYIEYYNDFASSKNLKKIGSELKEFKNNLLVTKAVYENENLVMHSYLFDDEAKRAVLFHSSSLFRNEHDSKKRSLIGRANRFLHYQDMLYFLKRNYSIYDLGGYAYDTKDPQRVSINEFKDSFHGQLKRENNYYPIWKYFYDKLKGLI